MTEFWYVFIKYSDGTEIETRHLSFETGMEYLNKIHSEECLYITEISLKNESRILPEYVVNYSDPILDEMEENSNVVKLFK